MAESLRGKIERETIHVAKRTWEIESSIELTQDVLGLVEDALSLAVSAQGHASPGLSNYKIGAGLIASDGIRAKGCNVEYGAWYGRAENRAIHAEEAAVAQAINLCGSELKISICAVVGDAMSPTAPCGKCRDLLRTFSDENTIIVCAGMSGKVILTTIDDLLPDVFERIQQQDLTDEVFSALEAAIEARDQGNTAISESAIGRTGVAVLTTSGDIYQGTREDSATWDPISAITSAIGHARSHGDPCVEVVAYVSDNGYMNGADRQKLYEKALELGAADAVQVYMLNMNATLLMKTNTKELLPLGFGNTMLLRTAEKTAEETGIGFEEDGVPALQ